MSFRMEMRPTEHRYDGRKDWEVKIFRGNKVVYEDEIINRNYQDARTMAEEILRDHSTVVYIGEGAATRSPSGGSRRSRYRQDIESVQEAITAEVANGKPFSNFILAMAAVQALYKNRGWDIPAA